MIKRTSILGRTTLALAGLLCLLVLGGCQSVASPVAGIWIQDVSFPLDAGTTRVGTKEGKACATSYVGVFARGDASIKAAAANGGITSRHRRGHGPELHRDRALLHGRSRQLSAPRRPSGMPRRPLPASAAPHRAGRSGGHASPGRHQDRRQDRELGIPRLRECLVDDLLAEDPACTSAGFAQSRASTNHSALAVPPCIVKTLPCSSTA